MSDFAHFYASYALNKLYSLPWNQSDLLGYFFEICFGLYNFEAYFIASGALLLLFISICWHHQAFYKMIQHTANKLELPDQNRNDKDQIIRKLITFHISAKEYVELWMKIIKVAIRYSIFFSLQVCFLNRLKHSVR